MKTTYRLWLGLTMAAALAPPALATSNDVHPLKGQSQIVQVRDEEHCWNWATHMTGYNPHAVGKTPKEAAAKQQAHRAAFYHDRARCLRERGYKVD